MRVIREDLHCTAVRITGGDAERLKVTATLLSTSYARASAER